MKSIKTEPQRGRLLSIDALRGVAALGVVLYHAVWQTSNAVPNNFLRWPVKGVQFLASFGYIGVFLFFVISGFCIHLQWARTRAAGQEPTVQFGAFWKRRVRRLYPPYLITLALFFGMAALTVGLTVTRSFVYDLVMHLLMLHNLDPSTCYSINGVFWTLAIEEQLYLGYFLLLFLRQRLGWGWTLAICALARVGWFFGCHALWVVTGFAVPVPEAAASHWFTWALGAIAVEAWFGLVVLPKWCRNIWLGVVTIVAASTISYSLPFIQKDTFPHDGLWLLMHPLWGFGFFAVVNYAVTAEKSWIKQLRVPRLINASAFVGVFSYSLYLTHELVIMRSWQITVYALPPLLNTLLVVTPATVAFAWLFFQFCEKPYLRKASPRSKSEAEQEVPESRVQPLGMNVSMESEV